MNDPTAAVAAVLRLHKPVEWGCEGCACGAEPHPPMTHCCDHCLDLCGQHELAAYPCETVRALSGDQ